MLSGGNTSEHIKPANIMPKLADLFNLSTRRFGPLQTATHSKETEGQSVHGALKKSCVCIQMSLSCPVHLTDRDNMPSFMLLSLLTDQHTNQQTRSTVTSPSCEANSYSDSQKIPTLYGIHFMPSQPNSSKSALISAYVSDFQTASVLQASSSKAYTSLLSQTHHNSQH
jgi:hypothetical protein